MASDFSSVFGFAVVFLVAIVSLRLLIGTGERRPIVIGRQRLIVSESRRYHVYVIKNKLDTTPASTVHHQNTGPRRISIRDPPHSRLIPTDSGWLVVVLVGFNRFYGSPGDIFVIPGIRMVSGASFHTEMGQPYSAPPQSAPLTSSWSYSDSAGPAAVESSPSGSVAVSFSEHSSSSLSH